MNTPPKTLALLIDGDNAQLKHTEQIIQFCKARGTLKIINAYGDWDKRPLSSHRQKMTELGVNLVPQKRVAENATDFALAMDAAVMLYKSEADIYFIASGDEHFTTVCQRISQKEGVEVFGVGIKSKASSKLRKACKKFFDVDKDILKKKSKASAKSAAPNPQPSATESTRKKESNSATKSTPAKLKTPSTETTGKKKSKSATKSVAAPKTKPKATDANGKQQSKVSAKAEPPPKPESRITLKMLKRAYQNTSQPQQDGWVLITQFRDQLRKIDTEFDQRFAKKDSFSPWLKARPEFEFKGHFVKMK